MTLITGNTYPVRNELKALGAKWDAQFKGWSVPDNMADKARELVVPSRSKSRSTYTRFSSGAVVYRNARGRCEDAPCCGCCNG